MSKGVDIPIVFRYVQTGYEKIVGGLDKVLATDKKVENSAKRIAGDLVNVSSSADLTVNSLTSVANALQLSFGAATSLGVAVAIFDGITRSVENLQKEMKEVDDMIDNLGGKGKSSEQKKVIQLQEELMSIDGIVEGFAALFGFREAKERQLAQLKTAIFVKDVENAVKLARLQQDEADKLSSKQAQNNRKRYDESLAGIKKLAEQQQKLSLQQMDKDLATSQDALSLEARRKESAIRASTMPGEKRDAEIAKAQQEAVQKELDLLRQSMTLKGADRKSIQEKIAEAELRLQELITDERDKQYEKAKATSEESAKAMEDRLTKLNQEREKLFGKEATDGGSLSVIASGQRAIGGGGGVAAFQQDPVQEVKRTNTILQQINSEIAKIRATPAYVVA